MGHLVAAAVCPDLHDVVLLAKDEPFGLGLARNGKAPVSDVLDHYAIWSPLKERCGASFDLHIFTAEPSFAPQSLNHLVQ